MRQLVAGNVTHALTSFGLITSNIFHLLERSGQQLRSRAATGPGCESLPPEAAAVLPTLSSLCDLPCDHQTTPGNSGEPCQVPPIQITGWVTRGDQQHPATFFFHLILCTVYTIPTHTYFLATSDFTATLCSFSPPKRSNVYMPFYLWIFAIYLHQCKCIW